MYSYSTNSFSLLQPTAQSTVKNKHNYFHNPNFQSLRSSYFIEEKRIQWSKATQILLCIPKQCYAASLNNGEQNLEACKPEKLKPCKLHVKHGCLTSTVGESHVAYPARKASSSSWGVSPFPLATLSSVLLRGLYRHYQWRYSPLSSFAATGNGGFSLAASGNGGFPRETDPLRYFFWNRPHTVKFF